MRQPDRDTAHLEEPPSPQPEAQPADRERVSLARAFGGRSVLRETAETVLLAVIVFLLLNALTARFRVHGLSMEPTMHDGQYLLISKVGYWFNTPTRGDVIVFHPPTRPGERRTSPKDSESRRSIQAGGKKEPSKGPSACRSQVGAGTDDFARQPNEMANLSPRNHRCHPG